MISYSRIGVKGLNGSQVPKEKINFTIAPTVNFTYMEKGFYILIFQNNCSAYNSPMGVISIDKDELQKKLESWLKGRVGDDKYISLIDFNSSKSMFAFDIAKWVREGMPETSHTEMNAMFTRYFNLTKKLPEMIKLYGMETVYKTAIENNVKEVLKTKQSLRKSIFMDIETIMNKTFGLDKINMFDYNYDYTMNKVGVSLKPIYIGTTLAAAAVFAGKRPKTKKLDFDKRVEAFLKFRK